MTQNTNIMIVILAGLALVGFIYALSPATAPAQIPALLVGLGVLIKLFNTDAKVEKADAKVEQAIATGEKSIAVSEGNALSIAASSQQQAYALEGVAQKQDTTNKLVDGHLSGLTGQIALLNQQVASLKEAASVKEAAQAAAAALASATAVELATAVAAPAPGTPAPAGGTPAHGTPVVVIAETIAEAAIEAHEASDLHAPGTPPHQHRPPEEQA